MLELFLDKEFANNYHLAFNDKKDEYVEDFQNYFIKKIQKLKLISNYLDKEDLMNQAKDNPLLELLIERIPKLVFSGDLLNEINSTKFPDTGSPFKMILSGENTSTCTHRRKQYGLEYLNPANLSERWQLYYSRRTDINKKTTFDQEIHDDRRFDSWRKFKPFIHPLNAIIIIDFYLLKWKDESELVTNLINNISLLLENLLSEASTETPIDITFVSEFKDIPPKKQKYRVERSEKLISDSIKLITNKVFRLNIVVHNKENYKTDFQEFHDRLIITNYFYIESGSGFSIFLNKGFKRSIKKNTSIKFRSILNIQNTDDAFFDLKQLDIYCKKLVNYPGRPDNLNFFPSKTNRLLNIEHS